LQKQVIRSEYGPGHSGTAKGSRNNNFRINIKYERPEKLICESYKKNAYIRKYILTGSLKIK